MSNKVSQLRKKIITGTPFHRLFLTGLCMLVCDVSDASIMYMHLYKCYICRSNAEI